MSCASLEQEGDNDRRAHIQPNMVMRWENMRAEIFQTSILGKSNVAASPKMLPIISKHTFLQGIKYGCLRRNWCIIGANVSRQEKRQHLT